MAHNPSTNEQLAAGLIKDEFVVRPYNERLPVVFMHVPKAAGVALTDTLEKTLQPRHIVRGFDRVLFGAFDRFDTFSAEERSRIYVEPAYVPTDGDFVSAHMALSTLVRQYKTANHMTILREPLSRILSHWIFWRGTADEYLGQVGYWAEYVRQARKPLCEFLCCEDLACVDNLTTRMLLWPHAKIPDGRFVDPQHDKALLDEAIGRLKFFAFVDLIENPQWQANLQSWLGKPLQWSRLNETNALPAPLACPLHDELTSKTIALLEKRTRLDLALWFAVARGRLVDVDLQGLRQAVVLQSVARYALLTSGK
jgi:hypothetical protein